MTFVEGARIADRFDVRTLMTDHKLRGQTIVYYSVLTVGPFSYLVI